MKEIHAYLAFDGNSQEAMTFYHSCLGGDLSIIKVKDTPMASQMPPEMQDRVMHSSVHGDGLTLFATDMSMEEYIRGNNMSLMLQPGSLEETQTLFNSLSAGGNVTSPLSDTFWGAKFGHFIDKFGVSWMVNYEEKKG